MSAFDWSCMRGAIGRMRPGRSSVSALLTAMLAAFCISGAAQAQWRPDKNVEIIVASGPAGGLDRTARTVEKIWRDQKVLPLTGAVVNKPGGSGAVGYAYLSQFAKDGHYLIVTSPTLLTNHILGTSKSSHTDFTAVAQLMSEYLVLYVRADSPLKSGRDLIERLRKDPAGLSIAIGSIIGGTTHIGTGIVLKAGGVDIRRLKTVVFKSGAENVTAILGGHIDVAAGPSDQVAEQVAAGKLRVLGVTAPQRLGGVLATSPTWKEQGVDALVDTWRGILGPTGLSPGQLAYWDGAFAKLVETDEWKKDVETHLWGNTYRDSAGMRKFLNAEYARLKSALVELGLVK